ncbi:MAG: AAA family ATPase [Flavobacteriaceae bacterium]|nr:AAA family ATPase [Flavobacteriaceae bacterium]
MSSIDKIKIHNFKAFYTGSEPEEIDLGGKHLLLYGENGSGKSSIYWALYTLFQSETKTDDEIAKYFTPTHEEQLINFNYLNNRSDFTSDGDGKIINPTDIGKNSEVEVILEDKTSLKIDKDGKHETTPNKIEELHRNSDFITHRLLVNFYNFRNSKEINLWEVFVRDFFPFLKAKRGTDNKSLWQEYKEIKNDLPFNLNHTTKRFKRSKSKIKQNNFKKRIQNFNEDLEYWISKINLLSNEVYKNELKIIDGIEIIIDYSEQLKYDHYVDNVYVKNGVKYTQGTGYAKLNSPILKLKLRRHNEDGTFTFINRPQAYLNEAKITQIALSIRFSLLHESIKPNYAGQFLALDDLLISLDLSNRDIVLDAILNIYAKRFKIYMFTHERSFFNMAKSRIESEHNKSEWNFNEIFGMDESILKPQILSSEDFLSRSYYQYKLKDYPASVNYLRKELEKVLTDNLPSKVKKGDSGEDKNTLDGVITSGINYLEKLNLDPLPLKKCQQYLQILLNPLSHNENDIDAYETDIKRIRIIIEELKPFLQELKSKTKEILPRLSKVNLSLIENDGTTKQVYTLELQEELYIVEENTGVCKLSGCKIHSLESRTYLGGTLDEKDDYKNERWKNNSLEELYKAICTYKTIEPNENFLEQFETIEGKKISEFSINDVD